MLSRIGKFMFVDEKGGKFTVKAPDGKVFKSAIKADGTLQVEEIFINELFNSSKYSSVSAGECAKCENGEKLSIYTDKNGNKAAIPAGWTVSGVPSENFVFGENLGLVMYHIPESEENDIDWENKAQVDRLQRTYDQLVWLPVYKLAALSAGRSGMPPFDKKFGRNSYNHCSQLIVPNFPLEGYYDPVMSDYDETVKSINLYGGEYITRYKISKGKNGEPRSIKGVYPWTDIDFPASMDVAANMSKKSGEHLISHLAFGAEYDTRIKWAVESNSITPKDVTEDSTQLGNYLDNDNYPCEIVKTGEDGCINNIYGFAGNTTEWTQEWKETDMHEDYFRVIRGGHYNDHGGPTMIKDKFFYMNDQIKGWLNIHTVEARRWTLPDDQYETNGFRAAYYINPD